MNQAYTFPTTALVLALSLLPSARTCAEDCDGNGIDDSLELDANLLSTWTGSGHEVQVAHGMGLAVLDVTGDGILDVIAASGLRETNGSAVMFEGMGDGTFSEPFELEDLLMRRPKVADLDKNGREDLIFHTTGGLRIAFDAHWSTLAGPPDIDVNIRTGLFGSGIEIFDVNRDGLLDIVAAAEDDSDRGIFVYVNDGAQGFAADAELSLIENFRIRTSTMEMEFGDFDGNSTLDLARHNFIHHGHGERRTRITVNGEEKELSLVGCDAYSESDALRVVDLNRDGKDELIHASNCGVDVYSYSPSGFASQQQIVRRGSGADLVAADFNRDGWPDIAVAIPGSVSVHYGDGSGQVTEGASIALPEALFVDSTAADIDSDGQLELLVGTWPRGGPIVLTVLQPRGPGDRDGNGQLDICEGTFFRRGDANGDGHVDVSDSLAILGYLFLGTRAPSCLDAADTDDNGRLELTDGHLVNVYLFLGGFSMPPPGPSLCLGDPSPDDLGCLTSNCQ